MNSKLLLRESSVFRATSRELENHVLTSSSLALEKVGRQWFPTDTTTWCGNRL